MWKVGFGLTSWLAKSDDEMPVYVLSPDKYLLIVSAISDGFSAVIGPLASKSPSQMVGTETSISAGFSIFCFVSDFHFRSDFYIRDSGGTAATPCLWPEDHGSGRFQATDVTGMGHRGRRTRLTGRQRESWLAWQGATTWGICWNGFGDFIGHLLRLMALQKSPKTAVFTVTISG